MSELGYARKGGVGLQKREAAARKEKRVGDAIWTEPSVRSVLGKSNNMKVLQMREGEKMSLDWQSSQNAT